MKNLIIFCLFLHSIYSFAQPTVRVDERAELMSIVFRLSGAKEYVTNNIPIYCDDIGRYFKPFENHAVVQCAQAQRINFGVGYDAVMSLAVRLKIANKAQIKSFRQAYFLVSQIDGTATFTRYYQHNQNVTAGQTVVTVVPNEKQKIIGKISLPPQRAGKVKVGQTVNVKFDDFPYQEYGMLKVPITDIALVPVLENSVRAYVLEVQFPDTLTTTYHKTLAFRQQMSGTAEIITEDLRLIERLVNPIRAIWKK